MEKDYIGKCPISGLEESCYITPINDDYNSYKSLITGFETTDLMKESEGFNLEQYEETLPELYRDIKIVDDEDRNWFPQCVNVEGKGIVFVLGTSKEDWGWASQKSVPVQEEEKERFKHPKTGEYIKFKTDPTTLQKFDQNGFIEALDSVGLLE